MSRPTILLGEAQFSPTARAVLEQVGDVLDFESRDAFRERLPDADAIVVGLELRLEGDLLAAAERLRVIASRTSQLRHLDVAEAARREIAILSIEPDAPALQETSSTAEETMALLLALVRNIPWGFDSVKAGRWERFRYGGHELRGKTIGLVGFGRLGRMVAGYARAFRMRVLAHDPYVEDAAILSLGAESVSLETLLRSSDAVAILCTWSDETRGLIGAPQFRLMREEAVFVNTARGEITDEGALLEALETGSIAGAAVDTLAGEQPDGSHLVGNALVEYARTHENLIVLPHLGGATVEATERTQLYISQKLAAWLEGAA
ncbi:MAG: NAD(P)-dependent oxidoreductase [Gaiellaceae bacterium]